MTVLPASAAQRDLLHEVGRLLASVDADAPAALPTILPHLRDLLRLDKALAYGVSPEPQRPSVTFGHVLGFRVGAAQFCGEFNAVISGGKSWGFFNPVRPEEKQRNRVVVAPPAERYDEVISGIALARFGIDSSTSADAVRAALAPTARYMTRLGLEHDHQMRMLVCDRDGVLAWVGGYRTEPFERAESALFQRLARPLLRRLTLERLMDCAPLARAALDVTLEALPSAAFIVGAHGRIAFANALGRSRLEGEPVSLPRAILAATRVVTSPDYLVTRLTLNAGGVPWFLVIAAAARGAASALPFVSRRWGLSPRQSAVLGELCEGASNKSIAARLEVSERTIEVHVTAIMQRAGVENRAALVAAFWRHA